MPDQHARFVILSDLVVAHIVTVALLLMSAPFLGQVLAVVATLSLSASYYFHAQNSFCFLLSLFSLLPVTMFCLPESYFVFPIFWLLLVVILATVRQQEKDESFFRK